nr:LOW QUALITY PROTEIN: phosphoglycerate mutase 2-like [Cherax quadricarinatus]
MSEWNKLIKFCGWRDAELEPCVEEAYSAWKALKEVNFHFDLAHTTVLTRAHETLDAILEEIGQKDIPVYKTWRFNERHYGDLTGLNKAETAQKHGEEQVKIWRRNFDITPPPMDESNPDYREILEDLRYADSLSKEEFPKFEYLKLTIERTLTSWNGTIVPQIKDGNIIINAAHGNSLRGNVKHLDSVSDEAFIGLNLPTGIPFVFELDESLKPVVSMKFLGDETVRKAMEAVAAQGKAKEIIGKIKWPVSTRLSLRFAERAILLECKLLVIHIKFAVKACDVFSSLDVS